MLEVSALDTFTNMHLGDVVPKNGGVGGVGVGRKAAHAATNESRASSSSSSSSGYGDEVNFQVTPQTSSHSTSTSSNSSGGNSTKKPSKLGGWWKNWRESEKVKEDKRKALEAARRRLRTNSLQVDDEQNASAIAAIQRRHNKMEVDSTDDSTQHDSEDVEPQMRPRSRTIASSRDISRKKLPTVFRWEGNAQHVYISGSFDHWKSRTPLVKSNDEYYTIIDLPPGDHKYRFLVDGQWRCDPNGVLAGVGENGLQSNVVSVRESDFEVFEALAVDIVSNGEEKQRLRSGSPVGEYSQDIPSRSSLSSNLTGPPVLPPHLLQVMLNKEVPCHCEPTLLPEPTHVMLNHLYALSIKEGVMVLSSSFRFQKKYVTTVLYKPA